MIRFMLAAKWLAVLAIFVLSLIHGTAQSQTTPNVDCVHLQLPTGSADTVINSAFDCIDNAQNTWTAIATGDANVALTAAQQDGNGLIEFTGAMTAGRDVTLLAEDRRLVVWNNTTGGFALTFRYATATGTCVVSMGLVAVIHADTSDNTIVCAGDPDIPRYPLAGGVDGANDLFVMWDDSAGGLARVIGDNLPGSGGGGGGGAGVSISMPPYVGARVKLDANFSLSDAVFTIIDWDSATFDTGYQGTNFAEFVTNPSRITIPNGVTKVILRAMIYLDIPSDTLDRWLVQFRENGAALSPEATVQDSNFSANLDATHLVVSGVREVSPGDYFEVRAVQDSTGSQNVLAGGSWFEIEVVETDADSSATVQTTDATTGVVLHEQAIVAGESIIIRATVIGRHDSSGDTYTAFIHQVCANEAGTTTCATQDRTEVELSSPPAAANAAIVADDTNDEWEIQVDGFAAATTVEWAGRWESIVQQ